MIDEPKADEAQDLADELSDEAMDRTPRPSLCLCCKLPACHQIED